jgi:hypothetical protein
MNTGGGVAGALGGSVTGALGGGVGGGLGGGGMAWMTSRAAAARVVTSAT